MGLHQLQGDSYFACSDDGVQHCYDQRSSPRHTRHSDDKSEVVKIPGQGHAGPGYRQGHGHGQSPQQQMVQGFQPQQVFLGRGQPVQQVHAVLQGQPGARAHSQRAPPSSVELQAQTQLFQGLNVTGNQSRGHGQHQGQQQWPQQNQERPTTQKQQQNKKDQAKKLRTKESTEWLATKLNNVFPDNNDKVQRILDNHPYETDLNKLSSYILEVL